MTDAYLQFLRDKAVVAAPLGLDIDGITINPILKHHQRVMVEWLVRMGRAANFGSFGIGKSAIQLEAVRIVSELAGGMGLIVAPLGVRGEFMRDAAMLGIKLKFIRSIEECTDPNGLYITNYETVRDGKLDPRAFKVTSLDEAAVLRGFGATKTFREFMRLFEGVPYKFIATATPSPNEFIELLAYSAYLEVMDVSQAKTRFFKRDSTKADVLTLHPHKVKEFWLWVSSWALFVGKPSDIGGDDTGYDLPELRVHWHELPADHSRAGVAEDGQMRLFAVQAQGLQEAAREKRDSLEQRVSKVAEIISAADDPQAVIWCDLNREQDALGAMLKTIGISCSSLYGSQDIDDRESLMDQWRQKETRVFLSKPQMYGAGVNLQQCHTMIFSGIGFKFADFIQGVHRIYRFMQTHPCDLHLIYTENERKIREILERKWAQHREMGARMTDIIREYGLDHLSRAEAMARAFGVDREEIKTDRYHIIHNDCVLETRWMDENTVGLILTSIPFCYDQDTEILTNRGWISFRDLTLDDDVATMSGVNHCFEWQKPSHIIWEHYEGDMLQFGNRVFDLLVTPKHRMYVARRGDEFSIDKFACVTAEEIAKDYQNSKSRILRGWKTCVVPPRQATGDYPEKIHIPPLPDTILNGHGVQLYWIESEDFMRLVGWYLSEGHADAFDKGRQAGRISIAQVTSEDLRQEIYDLFLRIGLPPSVHSRQITVWCRNLAYFMIKEFGYGSKQKHIPSWVKNLDPSLLTIMRDTMMKGDGAKSGKVYISYSKMLCDDFQEICLKTGWRATIKGNRVKVGTIQIFPEIRKAPDRVHYSGMIGCATVANGLLIVRRNGMPCVSGNSTQYEYSPNYADFGHTDDNEHFFRQMDFLTPELLRILKPGRMAVIHVKDRIVPGGMTGLGFQTVYPFHSRCIDHYTRHGFAYMGMKTIVTDVVRENNQTYRLGWTEQCKDATKMGVGMPEYLLYFRKPQTDTSRAYTDDPVTKEKPLCFSTKDDSDLPRHLRQTEPMRPGDKRPCVRGTGYSRARWQIDAHGFARSSGDRFPTTEEIKSMPHEAIFKAFRKYGMENIYEYEQHVGIGEDMEEDARLPVTFMLLQPPSWSPDVWTDVARMRCLNGEQQHKGKQMHLCLAKGSLVLTRELGYIPIETVSPGLHVLTHRGRWRPVLIARKTGERHAVTVRAQGVPGLTLTPDHKLWCRKSEWVRQREGAERTEPRWIEAQETIGGYLNQQLPPSEETTVNDPAIWWLVGRWLADGHWDARGAAIISCRYEKLEQFKAMAGEYCGGVYDVGACYQIRLIDQDRTIRGILLFCGSGAENKQIPPDAFTLPVPLAAALLHGYLAGDGHLIEDRQRYQMSSTSLRLLLGLSFLVHRAYLAILSISPGRPARECVIEGRTVNCQQEWSASFDINDTSRRKLPFIGVSGAWKRVSSINDAGVVETWNLRVEEDESYTAEGCIVKNCPMQFDIADRVIRQLSAPGDIVLDPFGGLMTVPYRSVLLGRYGMGIELSHSYFHDGAFYCEQASREIRQPTLFDFLDAEEEVEIVEQDLQDVA